MDETEFVFVNFDRTLRKSLAITYLVELFKEIWRDEVDVSVVQIASHYSSSNSCLSNSQNLTNADSYEGRVNL